MTLLADHEIVAELAKAKPLVTGVRSPSNWFAKDSPVQPASLDLHIGSVFIPGKKENEPGSEKFPEKQHVLETGHTAIVSTFETVQLTKDFAAFGFPPSRVSVQGLLMTNPGHVDPGYSGPLRFTVINMGRGPFVLRQGDPIVTLLLFKLGTAAKADWGARRGGQSGLLPSQRDIDRLSLDFLELERRAGEVANEELRKAEVQWKERQTKWLIWGGFVSAVAIILAALVSGGFVYLSGLKDLDKRTAMIERDLHDRVNVETTLHDLDQRLKAVEHSKTGVSQQEGK